MGAQPPRNPDQAPPLFAVPFPAAGPEPAAGESAAVLAQPDSGPASTRGPENTVGPAPDAGGGEPTRVGPGLGERLGSWAQEAFVPPEIWTQDRPSLKKQLAYAREGVWGPKEGWHRTAALVAFWGVSFPTSVAAYAIEWVGERPSRWITALVLISLLYQLPYVPEALGLLVRIPAWPLTATWSALGLMSA